jgi:hypothetical protein
MASHIRGRLRLPAKRHADPNTTQLRRHPQSSGRISDHLLVLEHAHDTRKPLRQQHHHLMIPENMISRRLEVVREKISCLVFALVDAQQVVVEVTLQ